MKIKASEIAKTAATSLGKNNAALLSHSEDTAVLPVDYFRLGRTKLVAGRRLSYLLLTGVILVLLAVFVLLAVINRSLSLVDSDSHSTTVPIFKTAPDPCLDTCAMSIVESIPDGLVFNGTSNRKMTYSAWMELLNVAEESIELAGMYWTLRGKDVYEDPTAYQGENIFKTIKSVVSEKGLKLRIAQNLPSPGQPNTDTEELAATVGAEVRSLDFPRLVGAGILHTKLWLVDRKHFYVGSANFDWRSLTQVKEVGMLVRDCPCLAEDIGKIWDVYWQLGGSEATIPDSWPASLATNINAATPLMLEKLDERVYLSSSPPPFCPGGREVDVDAIVKVILAADVFVRVAVMDYFPATIYTRTPQFWPVIDDAIRKVALEKGVKVELLMSHWAHTRPAMVNYLKSLQELSGIGKTSISVKLFTVPSFTPDQAKIPFGRVNHNKYLVTDKAGYIGTSNWSADYFISTGGIGLVFDGKLREDLVSLFVRDWTSAYATPV